MPNVHFVEDYERLVAALIAAYPIDEAMSLAVGGHFDEFGKLQADLLRKNGLEDGMTVVDLGCGSGRTAITLGNRFPNLRYTGKDVVQQLLNYAKSKSPRQFKFVRSEELRVPAEDNSVDLVFAFSLFTHLLHEETFIYMRDIFRCLKPRGKLIFSFLQFDQPHHWAVFESTVSQREGSTRYPMNSFIEEPTIRIWADKLGFVVCDFDRHNPMGQTICVLRRP